MDCVKLRCGQVGEIDALKYDKFFFSRPMASGTTRNRYSPMTKITTNRILWWLDLFLVFNLHSLRIISSAA
jgi:hypothetical protein